MTEDPFNAFITRVEPGPGGDGPLAGRTLAVKDLFDTAGIRTTYGSGLYADHVPERNATAVQRLLDAGASLVGKTHLPEFAWSVLGQSEWYGTCHNPTHPGKTTGGSSSGSAAALAAGLCPSSPSVPTPAARSACRRRHATSWASSRNGV